MRQNKREKPGGSLRTFFIFCIVVLILVFGSLSVKAFQVIKASRFDGAHHFTVAVFNPDGRTAEVIAFNPDDKTISILQLSGEYNRELLGKTIGTYIDGTMVAEVSPKDPPGQKMFGLAAKFTSTKTNITIIDLVRLAIFANSVPGKDVTSMQLTLPAEDAVIDALSLRLFADSSFTDEGNDIEIINATGVPGTGSRLERMLKNMGGAVLAVETGRNVERTTSVKYFREKTYAVRRLEKILGVLAEEGNVEAIADVKVILGTDSLSTKSF